MKRGGEMTKQGAMRSATSEQGDYVLEGVAKQLQVLLPLQKKIEPSLLRRFLLLFIL